MLFINALGGVALILLAIFMLSNGLKLVVGSKIKEKLQIWTANRFRALFSGIFLTAIIQSSSAITVASIGLVNAGVLQLNNALVILFGANVGTTFTGWIVSLVGYELSMSLLSMPLLTLGVIFKFFIKTEKIKALGETIIGFGLFLLGLDIMQESLAGFSSSFGDKLLTTEHVGGVVSLILIGFLFTLFTQSSSAAIAIILLSFDQGLLALDGAAFAIIGANVGTTSTALLVALNSSPNGKRLATGHVFFNVITALFATLLIKELLFICSELSKLPMFYNNQLITLALFHSLFNIFGALLLYPFVNQIGDRLMDLFKSKEEKVSMPKYLDKAVTITPSLSVSAIWMELRRLNKHVCSNVLSVIHSKHAKRSTILRKTQLDKALALKISEFIISKHMEELPREIAEEFPNLLRATRYLEEASGLTSNINSLLLLSENTKKSDLKGLLEPLFMQSEDLVKLFKEYDQDYDERVILMDKFEELYQSVKFEVLKLAVLKKISPEVAEECLDDLSRLRRTIQQLNKVSKLLHSYNHRMIDIQDIQNDTSG